MKAWQNFTRRIFRDKENYGDELNAIKNDAEKMRHESPGAQVVLTERAAEFLAGDVATEHDIRDIVNEMVDAKGSKTKVAFGLGISLPYLSDVMLGRRPVGGNLAGKLGGWEKVVVFRKR
jgi:hypothetical protein